MSVLLWIFAGYIVLDRLLTIFWIGKSIDITRGFAAMSMVTGACFVTVLVLAATRGVSV